MLSPQEAYQSEVDGTLLDSLRRIQKMDDIGQAFSGSAMEAAGVLLATTAPIENMYKIVASSIA